jgi:hypothetical protein
MSNLAIQIFPEPLRVTEFGDIGAGYTLIGTPFENPSRILVIQNLTDKQMDFSFNGDDDHLTLPSGGQIVLDVTANRTNTGGAAYFSQGIGIWVKYVVAPTLGEVAVSTFFGLNG